MIVNESTCLRRASELNGFPKTYAFIQRVTLFLRNAETTYYFGLETNTQDDGKILMRRTCTIIIL